MYLYGFNELYHLTKDYNKKHHQNIDVNELLDLDGQHFFKRNMPRQLEEPKVLYEDENYFGIYKPAGWIVNVGNKNTRSWDVKYNMNRNLLQVWLYKNLDYPLRTKIESDYGICNRLDIDTSGIVIVGKDEESHRYLRGIINEHKLVKKNYLALVKGKITGNGEIVVNIKCVLKRESNECFVSDQGKYAKTYYKVLTYLKDKDYDNYYTLLNVNIVTGRTHQIRVHMKMLNTYVIGDYKYTKSQKIFNAEAELVPRIFLHAYNYSFVDKNGKQIVIYAPLPQDLLTAVENNFTAAGDLTMPKILNLLEHPENIEKLLAQQSKQTQ